MLNMMWQADTEVEIVKRFPEDVGLNIGSHLGDG